MKKILLLPGDYFYTPQGLHECDDRGFAKRVNEDLEIEVEDSEYERVVELLTNDRKGRDLNPLI